MPFDRAATLKNAEKLLRQGKLEAAIAEYSKVVEEQPRDWNTANMLGDLFARAGNIDKAVEHYTRIADHLNEEGFLPKAAAIYKKVLKLKPDHEHALIQAGEIAASQGLLADARSLYGIVVERRKARGDARGAAQIRIRLGSLDAADYDSRMAAASARVEMGDVAGAVRDLKEIAGELQEKGRNADALTALQAAIELGPEDRELQSRLFDFHIAAEDFEKARMYAHTSTHLKALAETYDQRKRFGDALDLLRDAARLDPEDTALRAHLARAFMTRGDIPSAAEYLTVEVAGEDPQLLLMLIEMQLRGAQVDDALATAKRLLELDTERREQIAAVGWNVAEQSPEAAFQIVQLAAEVAVAQNNYPSAAAALQEFVTRVPNHIPALLRLVEICVDGALETTMNSAQAQLADAYIAAGLAAEARVIAEDLVAREPWERANIERFRTTLVLMNDPDPDAVIAERLSGQTPFTSTDLFEADLPPFDPDAPPPPPPKRKVTDDVVAIADESRAQRTRPVEPAPPMETKEAPAADRAAPPRPPSPERPQFELSANAVDIKSILGDIESAPAAKPQARARSESVEVDLSIVLDDIKRPAAAPVPEAGGIVAPRDEAARVSAMKAAERQFQRALELRASGDVEGCMAALQLASKAPKLRFASASLLGRLFRERGQTQHAIEWLERAAQAPAPTPEEYHQLLYDLADGLEAVGETARALAVCLELQADAGSYRDVGARVERLARVQTRG